MKNSNSIQSPCIDASAEDIESLGEALIQYGVPPAELSRLLARGTWLPLDAMLILLGIDPDRTEVVAGKTEYGRPEWHFSKAGPWVMGAFDDIPTGSEVSRLEGRLTEMLRLWDSEEHSLRLSPEYYIRWALDHGYRIDWIEAAHAFDWLGFDPLDDSAEREGSPKSGLDEGPGHGSKRKTPSPDEIRRRHTLLKAQGSKKPTKTLAEEFGVSERYIRDQMQTASQEKLRLRALLGCSIRRGGAR